MGMLGTLMNGLAFRDAFERAGFSVRVLSAVPMSGVVDHFSRRKAIHHLKQKRVVVFAGGTGNPLVTTDSAASLRGIEIGADIVFKATKVDGVYTDDPMKNPDATRYDSLSFDEAIEKNLQIMDTAAFALCREHKLEICVFSMLEDPKTLSNILKGESLGTIIG
jgi:uridylate kinase